MKKRKKGGKDNLGISKKWAWSMVILAAAVFGFIVWSPLAPNGGNVGAVDGNISEGETVFLKNCVSCHGAGAVGENPDHRNGGKKEGGGYFSPALDGRGHTWHHSPDLLFKIVKKGSPAKDSPMVGWQGRMTDGEIWSVLAYLRSIWPKEIMEKYSETFLKK